MYRSCLIFLLGAFTISVKGADHNLFRDCGRTDFCIKFRQRHAENIYVVDPMSANMNADTGTATFTMIAMTNNSANLQLSIWALENSSFRIKIKEVDSNRFELDEDIALDSAPKTVGFSSASGNSDGATIKTDSDSNTLKITNSPFKLEFFKDELPVVVLDGNDLILDNGDPSTAFAFSANFPQATVAYGIQEHSDHLVLQNTNPGMIDPYRLKNVDIYAYELFSPMAQYGAIPVVYGHGANATAGFFLHNAAEQWYDISWDYPDVNQKAHVMVKTGTLDLFVFLGPTIQDVVGQYIALTGTAHLPQLWTLGYHQSRYNYVSQDDVKDVIENFDNSNFQMDAIWLDIDYTDGKKYFTWDPTNFNDPIGMQNYIASTNRKLVTIIDPHVKIDNDYYIYSQANEAKMFINNSDGSNFEGNCWPGPSSWLDFYNPSVREYYAQQYSYENFKGSTPTLAGIWNDMNEPSVFDRGDSENTLPDDTVHYNGILHKNIHNVYGLLNTMATHQGLLQRDNGEKRPFVLTRSHFAGSQRFAAMWTGDNQAQWGYLAITVPECLTSNLLGIVFCGSDVGGFAGNPDIELLQRWYQAGAWLPFYRQHSEINSDRREPYLFDDNVQAIIRNAIELRYKHLPIWYTLFYEHIRTGRPVIRPLVYQYPYDINVFRIDNQLLLGQNIMVRPVTDPGVQSVQVYFPGGPDETWVSIDDTNSVHSGSEELIDIPVTDQSIPIYYRGGSVIARKDTVRRSTVEMTDDTHTLHAVLDQANKATGRIYLDDNISFKYRDNADYKYIEIQIEGDNVTIHNIDGDGDYDFTFDQVITYLIDKRPIIGQPGSYKKVVHDKDSNGKLLGSYRFDGKSELLITLG